MKGKLDLNGHLRIYRGSANPSEYQHQYCPFMTRGDGKPKNCGTWCPHFGLIEDELKHIIRIGGRGENIKSGRKVLKICHNKTLIFDEFEDENDR